MSHLINHSLLFKQAIKSSNQPLILTYHNKPLPNLTVKETSLLINLLSKNINTTNHLKSIIIIDKLININTNVNTNVAINERINSYNNTLDNTTYTNTLDNTTNTLLNNTKNNKNLLKIIELTSLYNQSQTLNLLSTNNTKPNNKILKNLLKLQLKSKSLQNAINTFDLIKNKDLDVYRIMIEIYSTCNKPEEAFNLFKLIKTTTDLKLNYSIFHSLLHASAAYCKFPIDKTPMEIIKQMKKYNKQPTIVTYSICMSIYAKRKDVKNTLFIYNLILEKSKSNSTKHSIETYNILMNLYAELGHVDTVNKMFQELNQLKLQPDDITFNILITANRNTDKLKECIYTLSQMKLNNFDIDTKHYNNVLASFSKNKKQTQIVFEEFVKNGLKPDYITFKHLIYCYSGDGSFDLVEKCLKDMKSLYKLSFDVPTIEIVLAGLVKYCIDYKKNKPDIQTSLLSIKHIDELSKTYYDMVLSIDSKPQTTVLNNMVK